MDHKTTGGLDWSFSCIVFLILLLLSPDHCYFGLNSIVPLDLKVSRRTLQQIDGKYESGLSRSHARTQAAEQVTKEGGSQQCWDEDGLAHHLRRSSDDELSERSGIKVPRCKVGCIPVHSVQCTYICTKRVRTRSHQSSFPWLSA